MSGPALARLLALSTLSTLAVGTHADEGADGAGGGEASVALGDVVVEAARTGQSIAELPRTVQVITRDELDRQTRTGKSLSEILGELVPALGPSSQTLTNFTQTLRGRDPLYLIDGVSQNSNRAISRQLTSLNVDQIERIEVISGATAIYGAGGSGGIINIITRRGQEPGVNFHTEVGVSAFTADMDDDSTQYRVSQSISGQDGPVDFYVGGSYEVRHGFFDGDGERIAPDAAQISRNDTDSWDFHVRGGLDLGQQRRVSASFQAFEDEQDTDFGPFLGGPGVPALFGAEVESRAVPGLVLDEQPRTRRQLAHIDYQDANLLGQDFRAQVYWRSENFRFYPFPGTLTVPPGVFGPDPVTVPYVNQSTNEAQVYGLRTAFTTPLERLLPANGSLTWGLDLDIDHNEADAQQYDVGPYLASGGLVHEPLDANFEYSPDVRTRSAAAFLQVDWQVTERLSLQAGSRYQDAEVKVDDYIPISEQRFALVGVTSDPAVLEGATLDYDAFVFNAGAVFSLTPAMEVFANFSQGFEQPDVARLLRSAQPPGSVPVVFAGQQPAVVSESELDAIKTDAWELGWRGHFERIESNLAVFYNQSDKTSVFDGQFVTLTDQKRRFYGVEGGLTTWFGDHLSAGGSFAWMRGHTRVDGEWQALNAWEVSPPKLLAFLQWEEWDRWSLRLQALHVGDYDEAFEDEVRNGIKIDGYTTIDLLGSLQVGPGRFGLSVTNLLDEDYFSIYAQQAGAIYGSFVRIPAFGRRVALSYEVSY